MGDFFVFWSWLKRFNRMWSDCEIEFRLIIFYRDNLAWLWFELGRWIKLSILYVFVLFLASILFFCLFWLMNPVPCFIQNAGPVPSPLGQMAPGDGMPGGPMPHGFFPVSRTRFKSAPEMPFQFCQERSLFSFSLSLFLSFSLSLFLPPLLLPLEPLLQSNNCHIFSTDGARVAQPQSAFCSFLLFHWLYFDCNFTAFFSR